MRWSYYEYLSAFIRPNLLLDSKGWNKTVFFVVQFTMSLIEGLPWFVAVESLVKAVR